MILSILLSMLAGVIGALVMLFVFEVAERRRR